jgi:curved DNA-binding protein CbpA
MQKLKICPDLGDSDWNEHLLDIAYDTLLDPVKRAAYDHELLQRYHIRTLSQGAFSSSTNPELNRQKNERSTELNQRNYYRILQIQPDAPIAVISASYQTLSKSSPQDIALLDEAYQTLSDPRSRQQYDAQFAASNFSYRSAEKPTQASTSLIKGEGNKFSSRLTAESYQTVITHYCSFCKTPYIPQTNGYQSENCGECASPLFVLQQENLTSPRRTTMRINFKGKFIFYPFWPSIPYQGLFQDLSPTGIRFLTKRSVDLRDIIKIDAPNLQAVAEITHQRNEGKKNSVGARFVTVKFEPHCGNFVKAQA